MLRNLFLLFLLFIGSSSLFGQRDVTVQVNYFDGTWEDVVIKYVPTIIRHKDDVKLSRPENVRKQDYEGAEMDLKAVNLMIHAGDTLLRAVKYQEHTLLGHLMSEGPVKLYRVVKLKKQEYTYFLYYRGRPYPLGKKNTAAVGTEILPDGCATLYPVRRMWNDAAALEFARQLNFCLTEGEAAEAFSEAPIRWRIGVAGLITESTFNMLTFDDGSSFPQRTSVFDMPHWSFCVETFPFRTLPGVTTQLQVRLLNERRSTTGLNLPGEPYQEDITITNAYLYPGIGLQLGKWKVLQPYAYGGLAFAVPLRFERTIEDPGGQLGPGYPVQQTIRNGQGFSVGYFFSYGTWIQFHRRVQLGLTLRREHLKQKARFFGPEVIPTRDYPSNRENLTPTGLIFFQAKLVYAW